MPRNKPVAAEPEPVKPPETPPPAATPNYVTVEQLTALENRIGAMAENFNAGISNLVNMQREQINRANAPAQPKEITEQEIDEAINQGGSVGAAVKKVLAQLEDKIVRNYVAPLQSQGARVIGQLSERVVKNEMPYYEMLKDKVTEVLNQLDPGLRMEPDVIKHAYDTVVGQNITKIVGLEIEKQLRQRQEPEPAADPKGGPSRNAPSGEPDFEEVFGKEALDSMRFLKGTPDPDAFAQRLGYKDAKDYLKVALEMEGQ